MKKLLFIPILFFAILSTNAQDVKKKDRRSKHKTAIQMTPEQRADLRTKRMTEQLSLTKDQQDKIYQLSLKQAKQRAEQREEQVRKRHELAQLMKEENQKNQQEIESLLSPEQQKKWTELKSQQMKQRQRKIDSTKKEFRRKGGMIKKPDSVESRRPADKIKPSLN